MFLAPLMAYSQTSAEAKPKEEAPEENLLSGAREEERKSKEKKGPSEGTFGEELMKLGVGVTWSGLGAVVFDYDPDGKVTFNDAMFHPILTAKIGEHLATEVEFEINPTGVSAHYAFLDYVVSSSLIIRAGKFLTPIGRFNDFLHPVFRWESVTYPLMFNEIIPAIWSDHGVQVRGTLPWGESQFVDYAVYLVNGAAITGEASDAHSGHAGMLTGSGGYLRNAVHDNFSDNNKDKGFGGRVGVGLFNDAQFGALRLGVSGYTAAVDNAARRRLTLLDVDASLRLGPFTLRGEIAQSYLGSDQDPFRPFERGFYIQGIYQVGRFQLTGRWDWAARWGISHLDPLGELLPEHAGMSRTIDRQAVFCVTYLPSPLWSLRLEMRVPVARDGVEVETPTVAPGHEGHNMGGGTSTGGTSPQFSAMVAFYF
jgi:hypothetical protein